MRQSQLFTKTTKEAPKGEESRNAQLLEQAGFIYKNMAGVYSYLPLGHRVLSRIVQVIREEMNAIGGQEVTLNTLQTPEIWKKTDRWDDAKIDIWFKTQLKNGSELGLAATHEEPLTELMTHHVSSYKDLPAYVYQFQTKFRNELRAKSGIMRTREFLMKDLYSFNKSADELDEYYEKAANAYLRIFERLGLGDITFRTFASGGPFSKFSDEFQTLCEAGEDVIYLHRAKKLAVNKEIFNDQVLNDLGLKKDEMEEVKAVEVGNIFKLGTRFSEALGLNFTDVDGSTKPVVMGSYGIGPGRVMGTIVEVGCDDKGIVWPREVAPFQAHLISLNADSQAEEIYNTLLKAGIEVLFDDRDERAGKKFADSDLVGIPYRIVISEKTLKENKIEIKERTSDETKLVGKDELIKLLAG